MNSAPAVSPDALAANGVPERADLSAWLAVIAGTLAAFMALLDSSIVNSALPVIQGEIGATPSEATWVGTSFLVAEIVIMPLTAWFERLFGLRRVLLVGSILFTVFSVVCGMATDLTTMVVGRIGQGLAGGVMIPTGMTIMARRLPKSQQAIGLAIFAASALLGPIVGPILGGWITDVASWHYAFFINVPICAGLVLLILVAVPGEPTDPSALSQADWFGVFGVMIALGGLTVLLEEGHREQWFESALIWQLAGLAIIGAAMVTYGQLRAPVPVLKLSLMKRQALWVPLVLMTVTGVVLFTTLFTVPQFLSSIAGYTPLQGGLVLATAGFVSILGAGLYPILISRFDIRFLVGAAIIVSAAASFLSSQVTGDSVGWHFVPSFLLMGFGTTFSAIPLQQAVLSAVDDADAGDATSLFNVARNLGGSIGLAVLASLLDQRIEFHHWRLHETIAANDPAVWEQLNSAAMMTGEAIAAGNGAFRVIDGQVMREALVMAFGDSLAMLSLASLLIVPLAMLLKPIDPERTGGMAH